MDAFLQIKRNYHNFRKVIVEVVNICGQVEQPDWLHWTI